jgi:IclR family pca regulon transcriptional regulator
MPPRIETVASFAKGLDVVRSFGAGARRQTITEVAARTGMTRAGARRFLHTLVETGYARSDGKHFELTARVLELGNAYISGLSELDAVRDALDEMAHDLGAAAAAATLDGVDVVCVARAAAPRRVARGDLAVGARRPALAGAAGLVLLADLGPSELDRFLRQARPEASPTAPQIPREALKARLAEVRSRGWASLDADAETECRSIAVALPGAPAAPRLALVLAAPVVAVEASTLVDVFLPRLRAAVRRLAGAETVP